MTDLNFNKITIIHSESSVKGIEILNDNQILIGQYWGQIVVYDLKRMQVIQSFEFSEFRYVTSLKKMERYNELVVLTEDKGVCFIQVSNGRKREIKVEEGEVYFKDHFVSGVQMMRKRRMSVISCYDRKFIVINRKYKKIESQILVPR